MTRGFLGALREWGFTAFSSPLVHPGVSGASLFEHSVAFFKYFPISFNAAPGGAEKKKAGARFSWRRACYSVGMFVQGFFGYRALRQGLFGSLPLRPTLSPLTNPG